METDTERLISLGKGKDGTINCHTDIIHSAEATERKQGKESARLIFLHSTQISK